MKHALIGVCRDLRGVTAATNNRRSYGMLFDVSVPRPPGIASIVVAVDSWFFVPCVWEMCLTMFSFAGWLLLILHCSFKCNGWSSDVVVPAAAAVVVAVLLHCCMGSPRTHACDSSFCVREVKLRRSWSGFVEVLSEKVSPFFVSRVHRLVVYPRHASHQTRAVSSQLYRRLKPYSPRVRSYGRGGRLVSWRLFRGFLFDLPLSCSSYPSPCPLPRYALFRSLNRSLVLMMSSLRACIILGEKTPQHRQQRPTTMASATTTSTGVVPGALRGVRESVGGVVR